ncbi:uncharacterized protein LOC131327676 [Rhododendron vialii]|uniref:uncharacterized protein LOC131327676 n=1 Tax=Rhododendron vialii TaxID=182163 RepID=UPI00265FC61E|nr:uncharacterized protein LOC131327676 [Rhododendron vialii]
MGEKRGRGDLNGFRIYLDELRPSQVEWDPWRVAEPEPEYLARSRVVTASRVMLESAFGWQWYLGDRVTRQSLGHARFQVPGPLPPRASHTGEYTLAELEIFTRLDTDLTCYLRLGMDYAIYQRERLAGPLRVREFRESSGESRARRGPSGLVRGGPPELTWQIAVVDFQGNPAELHLVPARVEPAPVTVPVPNEWVNEAVRRMLALENVKRRAASGLPLDLRYPPPAAQRSQAEPPRETWSPSRDEVDVEYFRGQCRDALTLEKRMPRCMDVCPEKGGHLVYSVYKMGNALLMKSISPTVRESHKKQNGK